MTPRCRQRDAFAAMMRSKDVKPTWKKVHQMMLDFGAAACMAREHANEVRRRAALVASAERRKEARTKITGERGKPFRNFIFSDKGRGLHSTKGWRGYAL